MNTISTALVDRTVDQSRPIHRPGIRLAPATTLPWETSGVIATARDERAFVFELAARCGGVTEPHDRPEVTALLNALRGGLTPDELLGNLPGLRPGALYGSYLLLDSLRRDAVVAWEAIAYHRDLDAVERYGDRATPLVPVMVDRLRRSARIDPERIGRVVDFLTAGVADVRAEVDRINARLESGVDNASAVVMSQALYRLDADCLFSRPDHVPGRVGALLPVHVAALLGERPTRRSKVA